MSSTGAPPEAMISGAAAIADTVAAIHWALP
jgi:hypothetical protein